MEGSNGTLSPSSFIPFCSFAGNWTVTGEYNDMFSIPVCNIFKETMLDGQLCYQADLNSIRDQVDKKMMVTKGFVFLLDYNENRNVRENYDENMKERSLPLDKKEGHEDAMIYIETLGKNINSVYIGLLSYF